MDIYSPIDLLEHRYKLRIHYTRRLMTKTFIGTMLNLSYNEKKRTEILPNEYTHVLVLIMLNFVQ